MGSKTKTTVWIVVAAAVLAAIIWYAASRNTAQPPVAPEQATQTPGSVTYAPTGQLAPGFPRDLILDSHAAVSGSYSINYSSTTNQYTASWTSSSSMLSLYGAYKQYFSAKGWTITNDDTQYPNLRVLYATNGSSTASADIVKAGSGSQATVTYVEK